MSATARTVTPNYARYSSATWDRANQIIEADEARILSFAAERAADGARGAVVVRLDAGPSGPLGWLTYGAASLASVGLHYNSALGLTLRDPRAAWLQPVAFVDGAGRSMCERYFGDDPAPGPRPQCAVERERLAAYVDARGGEVAAFVASQRATVGRGAVLCFVDAPARAFEWMTYDPKRLVALGSHWSTFLGNLLRHPDGAAFQAYVGIGAAGRIVSSIFERVADA